MNRLPHQATLPKSAYLVTSCCALTMLANKRHLKYQLKRYKTGVNHGSTYENGNQIEQESFSFSKKFDVFLVFKM